MILYFFSSSRTDKGDRIRKYLSHFKIKIFSFIQQIRIEGLLCSSVVLDADELSLEKRSLHLETLESVFNYFLLGFAL